MLALVVTLVLATALLASPGRAGASQSTAADQGRVRGEILSARGTVPKVSLLWFDTSWRYLGARKVTGGAYSLSLPAGSYFLQAVDLAPSFDVTKNRPSTVKVTVRAGSTAVKSIRMRRGASIGGTVLAGGKLAKGARIIASNTDEQSFETTADRRGRFALGGLPPGTYSVFTYDRGGDWVGRSTYLPQVKGTAFTPVAISLTRRSGGLLVDLYAGRTSLRETVFVTAVSRATGQFWTARSMRGSVTFTGLHPGRYDLQVPGAGSYLPARVPVRATVTSDRVVFGSARLTQRGGWVTGTVVDRNNPTQPLGGAAVRLVDSSGITIATASTDPSGQFTLDGQLVTQKGMTVVAGPRTDSPYLGQGTSYCKYATTRITGVALSTGKRTAVGSVALAHLPNDQQDGLQCYTLLEPGRAAS